MTSYTNTKNSKFISTGSFCSPYAQLGTYNSGYQGIRPPIAYSTSTSGYYVVPAYTSPGYDTLQHGQTNTCPSTYFSIVPAYGADANVCSTRYQTNICQ